jgi:outer membrane protein assembly factor BamB
MRTVMPRWLCLSLALAFITSPSLAEGPLGTPPTYTDRKLGVLPAAPLPNEAAFLRRIWMPGLDQGFIPQGLTVVDEAVYVAAYRSVEGAGRGPCRLFRLDARRGQVTGTLDLPVRCGHAGGAARGAPGHLWVVDTQDIFEVRLDRPARAGIGSVVRHIRLTGQVKGSFAAGTGDALWLGTYQTHGAPRLYRFPLAKLKPEINESDADASVVVPERAQGAAFDAKGQLWVSRSSGSFGELVRLDQKTGAVRARFALPAGTEDISFDAKGHLWTVSEAGSQRWLSWSTFFPVIFEVDISRLR